MMAAPLAAQPAGAVPAPGSGCKTTASPGSVIAQFPAIPGSMSLLEVACTFRNDTGNSTVTPSYTIHDFDIANWHNGAARSVTNPLVTVPQNTATITIADPTATTTCGGITGWVNHPITAAAQTARLLPRTFVKTIVDNGATCTLTLNRVTAPTGGTIPINTAFKIDNSNARAVDDGVLNGTTTVTSATMNFTSGDVGLELAGTNITPGTTIASVTNPTTAVLSAAATAGTAQVLTLGGEVLTTTTRQVNDASTTATQITSNVAAFSLADDVGLPVYGPGIPANSFITTVNGLGTKATVNTTMTVQAGPISVTIGDPSATAPANDSQVADQGVEIDLNPGLVAGSNACSLNNPEGFAVAGKWRNPVQNVGGGGTGGFTQGGLTLDQPANTRAIGQIVFDTSAADWAGYVVQRGVFSPGDPQGNPHFDIVFPFVPTGLGMCPSNANSPGLGFSLNISGTAANQSALAAGTGKPGTAQLRNTVPFDTFPTNSSAYVDSQTTPFPVPSDFSRLCIVAADVVNFQCGAA